MNRYILKSLLATSLLFASFTVFATPGDGPNDNPDTEQAPIDGGVSLLIAAGVAYGAKKAHEHRKKQREAEQDKLKM